MAQIEVLLHGVPGRTSQGYISHASAAIVDRRAVVDVGSLTRRPLLEKTLEGAGIDPETVEDVLLTHVHYDHCDNVDLFPNATLHVDDAEYRRVERGELDWATPRGAPEMFADHDLNRFEVGDVIAGLEVVATPGHTEHHVSFVLEDDDLTVGFAGDAVKNVREVATMDPMVLYDKAAAVESIERLCEAIDFVIPGHDTPFYITEEGEPVPALDVDFGVNLQVSKTTAVTTDLSTDRADKRPLPDNVSDVTARQAFH